MIASLSDTTRGILFMVTAIFFFSCMEVMGKYIGLQTSTAMAIWARYAGQALVVLLLVLPRIKTVAKTKYPPLQLLRSVLLLIGTTGFFISIVNIGLAATNAIFDVNPVLVTLAATVVLGERLGPRRIFGILACLTGAMIIIRPGTEVFTPYMLLPLMSACAYTGYVIATRFVGRDELPITSLLYTAAFGAIVLTVIVPFYWVTPPPLVIFFMVMIGILGAIGHFFLIRAFTIAEAGILAPFIYVGLLFAIIWGMVLFDEFPDIWTYVGAVVIVSAGIYVWRRETQATQMPA